MLSGPSNASLGDRSGTGTILDNEGPLFATINDPNIVEGDSGLRNLAFKVTLSSAPTPGQTVILSYQTVDGTATAGSDYTATSGTIQFTNATGATRTINVPVSGDTDPEADETLTLNLLNPVRGVVADVNGTGTLYNDD